MGGETFGKETGECVHSDGSLGEWGLKRMGGLDFGTLGEGWVEGRGVEGKERGSVEAVMGLGRRGGVGLS